MRKLICAAGILLITGCAVIAGPPPLAAGPFPASPVADTPIEAEAGGYTLDPRHTSVIWRVRHMNLSMYTARFNSVEGKLTLDPAAPARSALTVSIDAHSVDTGLKDKDGKASFDTQIADVLGAAKTPKITFTANTITRTGSRTGLVSGDLTMNGVTKPAVLETTFVNYAARTALSAKPVIAFSGHAVIKRSNWGASNAIFSLFAGDEVEIIVEAEFNKD